MLNLPKGKSFTMKAEGLSDATPYVGEVWLNGKPLAFGVLQHEEILAAWELRFVMRAEPNTTWAVKPAERPLTTTSYGEYKWFIEPLFDVDVDKHTAIGSARGY